MQNIKWSPAKYKAAAVYAHLAGEELLSRLEWMTLQPATIVDIGCGVGELGEKLRQRFDGAVVYAVDHDAEMLAHTQQYFPQLKTILTSGEQLPFKNQSVDLIVANMLLPWHNDIEKLLKEWRRVLHPDGLLMLTVLGPDTLRECEDQLAQYLIPHRIDMHDVGDGLVQAGFVDPVLDVEHVTLSYRDLQRMQEELQAGGLLSENVPNENVQAILAQEGEWLVTLEIVHAHAWNAKELAYAADKEGVARIPVSVLRR